MAAGRENSLQLAENRDVYGGGKIEIFGGRRKENKRKIERKASVGISYALGLHIYSKSRSSGS